MSGSGTREGPATRATRQRSALLELLQQSGDYYSARELHSILRGRGEAISLPTVYQALQFFLERGSIQVLYTADGGTRYRRCARPAATFISSAGCAGIPKKSPVTHSKTKLPTPRRTTDSPTYPQQLKSSESATDARDPMPQLPGTNHDRPPAESPPIEIDGKHACRDSFRRPDQTYNRLPEVG